MHYYSIYKYCYTIYKYLYIQGCSLLFKDFIDVITKYVHKCKNFYYLKFDNA